MRLPSALFFGFLLPLVLGTPDPCAAARTGAGAPRAGAQPASGAPRPPRHQLQWQPLAPMPGGAPSIWKLVETPAAANRLYGASAAGPIVSDDAGLSWRLGVAEPVRGGWFAWGMAASAANADVAITGVGFLDLLRTDDGGNTWSAVASPPTDVQGVALAMAPTDSNRVFISTEDGVWRSKDGGLNFEEVLSGFGSMGTYGGPIAIDPHDAGHVYVDVPGVGMEVSRDGGDHWQIYTLPTVHAALSLGIDPNDGNRVLFGSYGDWDVLITTDGASTWTVIPTGYSSYIDAIAIDPADPKRFQASVRGSGLVESTDGGASWKLDTDPALAPLGIGSSVLPSANDANLLLLGGYGGVFRSIDRGATFARISTGLESNATVHALVVDPFDARHLVARSGGSAYVSNDGGRSWTESAGLTNVDGFNLSADPVRRGRFYTGTSCGGFWRSNDRGATWVQTAQIGSGTVAASFTKIAAHPTILDRVFTSTIGFGLLRSDDAGTTFVSGGPLGSWTWGLAISPVDPNVMYCGSGGNMFWSDDGGANWTFATAQPESGRDIVADPDDRNVAYAVGVMSGLWRTENHGQTWSKQSDLFLDSDSVFVLRGPTPLLVASDLLEPNAYVSATRGASGTRLGFGLTSVVTSFAATSTHLLASTWGAGAWMLR